MMTEVVMIVFMMMAIVMMKVNSISQEYLNNDLVISRSHPFSLPPQVYICIGICIVVYVCIDIYIYIYTDINIYIYI